MGLQIKIILSKLSHKLFFCGIFIFALCQLHGQSIPPNIPVHDFEYTPPEDQVESEIPDVNYFYLSNLEEITPFSDTTLNDFEIYAKHRTFENAAINLGNYGSALQKIAYENTSDIYTDMGYHQYDLYKINADKLRFYKTNKAFNDLYFSPVGGQQNFEVKAKFTNNFQNDINLSIDLERIKQGGFYNNQDTKGTRFGIGLWKQGKEKKHNLFISFLANNFNEVHNGGVDTTGFDIDNVLPEIRGDRTTVPTLLNGNGGITRHQHFTYSVDNFWSILSDKFKVHHRLLFENGFYRFGDDNVATENDSLVYLSYITDTRGIRAINKFSALNNVFDVGWKTTSFNITIGLKYRLLSFNNSIASQTFNDIGLNCHIDYKLGNLSRLIGYGELGVGENAGNLQIKGDLTITPIKGIELIGKINLLRNDPSLLSRNFYTTQNLVYQNDFVKTNTFEFEGLLNINKLGLSFGFKSGLLDNPIFVNDSAIPQQLNGNTSYIQLKANHQFFWKFIGIDNALLIQKFDNNIYNLPHLYSQHNAYLQSRIFKKRLLARLGILFYNTRRDNNVKFQPVNGLFYPTQDEVEYFPYSELYATFQVDNFRIFFRFDNFTDRFDSKVHYQVYNYPQFDSKFRMGIRWIIYD